MTMLGAGEETLLTFYMYDMYVGSPFIFNKMQLNFLNPLKFSSLKYLQNEAAQTMQGRTHCTLL